MPKLNREQEEALTALDLRYRREAAQNFVTFAHGLVIPGGHGAVVFGDVMAEHQKEAFAALAPSLEAMQQGVMPPVRRFWMERTKKAGKDADLAVCILWLLAFIKRPLYLQVGAADRDQANIVKQRIEGLLYCNPWLSALIKVHQYKVTTSTNGYGLLDIMAADIAGAHGGTPDVLIVNELSHVTKWEFVENLLDNADGVPQGLVIIATNAGFIGTKAHRLREAAEKSDAWKTLIYSEPAPWINQVDIEEAQRRNPPSRFARLWHGRWVSGKGDAISEDAISACFVLQGPQMKRRMKSKYVGGLDLGVSHDHAALVVLEVDTEEQKIRLASFIRWRPRAGKEIDLIDVEERCLQTSRFFSIQWLGYDPYQAKLMAQRLHRAGVVMREAPFIGQRLDLMASTLCEVLESGKLELYDDSDRSLQRDIGKLNVVERPYGLRLEAVSDEMGHADVATALVIALPKAVDLLALHGLAPDEELAYGGEPIADHELDAMPDELRSIYESTSDYHPRGVRRGAVRGWENDD